MEFFALKFQFWISKHRDEDQEIQNDTEHAAGEVLSGGDEEVGVVPANIHTLAGVDEGLKSPGIFGGDYLTKNSSDFFLHFRGPNNSKKRN